MMKKKNQPLTQTKEGKYELSPQHLDAIKRIENTGTAMMQTSQEFLIAIEDVLQKEFAFSESDFVHFETKLRLMLVTLADVERKGLSVLSQHDMGKVGEIAEIREQRLQEQKTGIHIPTSNETKKITGKN